MVFLRTPSQQKLLLSNKSHLGQSLILPKNLNKQSFFRSNATQLMTKPRHMFHSLKRVFLLNWVNPQSVQKRQIRNLSSDQTRHQQEHHSKRKEL